MSIKIANAAGFYGDRLSAARQIVDKVEIDYLTLEYLAELTMSILAMQREKNASLGYALDFLPALKSICPTLFLQSQLKIVTNAGGVNPVACAEAASALLVENGSKEMPIGVVRGDSLLDRIEELIGAGYSLAHLDSGQPLHELQKPIVAANAYLGAEPITAALAEGARIVITGRVADASLTVGPAVHEFGWAWDDVNRMAAATVAGHLIECGAQATGGYTTSWKDVELTEVGYPIAELEPNGNIVITKPPKTDGAVTRQTVVEQLVYEIGDPKHYLTPDVDVDFTTVQVNDLGNDRVEVSGATGNAAPESYKVSLAYHAGFSATAELLVWGHDCIEKANAVAKMIFARTEKVSGELETKNVELLGTGAGVPGFETQGKKCNEVMLRMSVSNKTRPAVAQFTREIAPMITSGPAGLAGYASGRARVRPVFAYWPTTIPKDVIEAIVEVRAAKDWEIG